MITRSLGPIALVLTLVAASACARPSDGTRGDTLTVALDSTEVPAGFRALTPLAQEWGIGDDVARGNKVSNSTVAERQKLRETLAPHDAAITAWLNTFRPEAMSDEAAAFMYTQLALEEITVSGMP